MMINLRGTYAYQHRPLPFSTTKHHANDFTVTHEHIQEILTSSYDSRCPPMQLFQPHAVNRYMGGPHIIITYLLCFSFSPSPCPCDGFAKILDSDGSGSAISIRCIRFAIEDQQGMYCRI